MTMLTMLEMLTMMIITTPEGSQGAETKAHFFHPWVGAALCWFAGWGLYCAGCWGITVECRLGNAMAQSGINGWVLMKGN